MIALVSIEMGMDCGKGEILRFGLAWHTGGGVASDMALLH
jgi:hypothetical protein